MTREEKINTLKAIIQECEEYQWQRREALFEIIKDLEQEPILDKISAEIELIDRYSTANGHDIWLRTPEEIKEEVLQIIDKYKKESEVRDE